MEKIIITGANGRIGKILVKGLKNYKITKLDLPKYDIRKINLLRKIFPGHSAIIHLAWDTKQDNFKSEKINPDNNLMIYNVYQAALESKVKKVIMASSVHADYFYNYNKKQKIDPYKLPTPDSPYGAQKVFLEALGRYYATKGLQVICIRFGGTGYGAPKKSSKEDPQRWLSDHDCIKLIDKCLKAKNLPKNFAIIYAMSESKNRIFSLKNPVGWKPQDYTHL